MDRASIRAPRDEAIQRVHFSHQMPLAQSADGGVAGHRTNGRLGKSDKRRSRALTRCGPRRLATRMASTDHNDIKSSVHGRRSTGFAGYRQNAVPRGTSFADAEFPEQRVQHILCPGPTRQRIYGPPRQPQMFGEHQQIRGV